MAVETPEKLTKHELTEIINQFPYEIELVPLDKLTVDKRYQRPLKPGFLAEMVRDFRPAMIGTLMVSERKDNRDYIIDGQHRYETLKGVGWTAVYCCVYRDLTPAQEAILFADVQIKRRGVASYERFRAALAGGSDPRAKEAKGILESVQSVGYTVGPVGSSKYAISAVAALEHAYRQDPTTLERGLLIYYEGWGGRVPKGWQISGMFRFLSLNPDVDDSKLVRRMSILDDDELAKRVTAAKQVGGSNSATKNLVTVLKAAYGMRERA